MCAAGNGEQKTVCKDVGVAAEQFGKEGDIGTTSAGEPGADFLLSDSLRSTPAPTHLALALWYDQYSKQTHS